MENWGTIGWDFCKYYNSLIKVIYVLTGPRDCRRQININYFFNFHQIALKKTHSLLSLSISQNFLSLGNTPSCHAKWDVAKLNDAHGL